MTKLNCYRHGVYHLKTEKYKCKYCGWITNYVADSECICPKCNKQGGLLK
jgi:hypothetical protein